MTPEARSPIAGLQIRHATPDDAPAIAQTSRIVESESPFMLYGPGERTMTVEELATMIGHMAERGTGTFLIALADEVVVGYLSAQRRVVSRIRHRAHIAIGIREEFTGRGIGTRLFEELEVWARGAGVTRLELTVMTHNDRGVALYRKQGFAVEGTFVRSLKVEGAWVDEYAMAKLLPESDDGAS
jgi:RimJ/RimL family protein N-acetyltransferase